jgi:hypothetical protein
MSLWHPSDLVADADLTAYERTILTQFGASDWQTRRQKALDDWLFPYLEGRGFSPDRLKTRAAPDSLLTYDGAAFASAASDVVDGLNLATLLSASTKFIYLGSKTPFRGLWFRMFDTVNATARTLTVSEWADAWTTLTVTDGTAIVAGTPFARGGSIVWAPVETAVKRIVNGSDPMYWARVSLSGAPSAGLAGPVGVVRKSRLCAPATFRTLELIFREAPSSQEGPWLEKAEYYAKQAELAWLRVVDQIGPEFDTDGDDAIDGDENDQTANEVSGYAGFMLERG